MEGVPESQNPKIAHDIANEKSTTLAVSASTRNHAGSPPVDIANNRIANAIALMKSSKS
jgi:hypothetical protein